MASIVISFDTASKAMSVSVDGKPLDHVVEAMVMKSYSDDESFSCCITTMMEDKEKDMRVFTRLAASESSDGQKALREGAVSRPDGLVAISSRSKLDDDILTFFAR